MLPIMQGTKDAEYLKALQEITQQLKKLSDWKQGIEGESSSGPTLQAPRKQNEFLFESISNLITEFSFDLETNSTFENWFNRYGDLFSNDAKSLDDNAKIRLLLLKLDTPAHSKYINYILPNKPTDFSFEETVKTLTKIFTKQETLFSRRFKCLNSLKKDEMDIITYCGLVNKACEDFDIKKITVDEFKCLIFIMGLRSNTDIEIRTKLLSKMEGKDSINLDKLLTEYQGIISLKHDTSMIQSNTNSNSILVSKVSKKKKFKSQTNKKACANCGEYHESKDQCSAKAKACEFCNNKGHIVDYCRKKQKSIKESNEKQNKSGNDNSKTTTSKGKTNGKPKVTSVSMNQINLNRKYIDIQINSQTARLQIDSAADITIISRNLCSSLNIQYLPTTIVPNCASGKTIDLIGEFECDVTFRNRTCHSIIYVSDINNLNIFGIDLFNKFNLWKYPIDDFSTKQVYNVQQQNNYATFLKTNFPACFEETLGKCKMYKATLTLKENTSAPFCKSRPVPFAIQPLVEKELQRLQSIGIITPITTANCAAPIVATMKKSGQVRICGDFSTGLNNAIHDHHYPLPLPEDIFAKLNGCMKLSHIDFSDAFLQIEVDDRSKDLLVINTHIGLYRYNRLSFGIKTAPTIFQEIMDKMISGLPGVICYMDDIFIYGKSNKAHDKALILLMNRITEFGFKIKLEKSKFGLDEITYLGCVINKNGIKPDPKKVEAIKEMTAPANITELRSFLGTINFYCKFISGIHKLRAPLDELLRKDVTWNWSNTHQRAFEQLKKSLSSEMILTHYNPRLDIIVSADASNKGLGACIQHRMSDNSIRPIAYAARSLKDPEKKYSQIEKEALGIIFAVNKFHKYIFGRKFKLKTDHKPLLAIFGNKKGIPVYTANRLQRWAINLLAYDFDIDYINTESFAYVDSLSRLINQTTANDDDYVIAAIDFEANINQIINKNIEAIPVKNDQLKHAYLRDNSMQRLIELISSDWKNNEKIIKDDTEFSQYYNRRELLSTSNEFVLFGDRIVIPKTLRENIIKQLHTGHTGMDRMKNLARMYVYWPNIDKEIETFVRSCKKCALQGKTPTKTQLQSWPVPAKPWERIHIDYAGPFKQSSYLIVVDAYSKWPEIFETKTTTSTKTIELLTSIFARFGTPIQIVSDNGTQFTSEQFQSFCNINGIEHIRTSPYHPMSNGQAERFVDTFKRSMKKLEGEGNLREILHIFLKTYRSTPNKNCPSNKTPAEALLGRKIRTTFDLLTPSKMTYSHTNTKMEEEFNSKHGAVKREFEVGDKVYVQIHTSNSWHWEEGEIMNKIGKVNYTVNIQHREIRAHANQIKMRFTNSTTESTDSSFKNFMELFDDDSISESNIENNILSENTEITSKSSYLGHTIDQLTKLMKSLHKIDREILEPTT